MELHTDPVPPDPEMSRQLGPIVDMGAVALQLVERLVEAGIIDWSSGVIYGDDSSDTVALDDQTQAILDIIWAEQAPRRERRQAAERVLSEQRTAEGIERVWAAARFTSSERLLFAEHGYDHRDVLDFIGDTQPQMLVMGGRRHR